MPPSEGLTVAVTGLSGTVGHGLLPFLEEDERIGAIIGVGSRPRASANGGSSKLLYRQADVRDRHAIRRALRGANVVIHLAFSLYGLRQSGDALEEANVQGSINVLDAAIAVGAKRFIYTSSGAVYGFDSKRPVRVAEDAPLDPKPRHFYSRHKRQVEDALLQRLEGHPDVRWVFFRPCAVVGPHAAGAGGHWLPGTLGTAASAAITVAGAAGLRPPVPGPPVPLQFVHERDVGQAIHRAITTGKTDVVYNLGGNGMVEASEVPRLVGLRTLPVPSLLSRAAVSAASRVPYVTPALGWLQLATHPLELDSTRAKRQLGWRPEFTSAEALASTRRALGI